jgi:hypothetical protein
LSNTPKFSDVSVTQSLVYHLSLVMLVLLNLLVYHLSLVMLVLLNMTSVSVTVSVTKSLVYHP